MNTTNKPTSWLHTLAGQITALTAVIVAVTGLIAAIKSCSEPVPVPRNDNYGRIDTSLPKSPAVVSLVNITGKWVNHQQGHYYQIEQTGNQLSYHTYDAYNKKIGYGNGSIYGRDVRLSGTNTSLSGLGYEFNYTEQYTLADSNDELTGSVLSLFSSETMTLLKAQ